MWHFYENMETGRPFTAAFHIGEMLDAYDSLRAHAPTPRHIVPGHDPEVMRRYPPPRPELEGVIARLDVPTEPIVGAGCEAGSDKPFDS